MITTKTYILKKINTMESKRGYRKAPTLIFVTLLSIMISTTPLHGEELSKQVSHVIACETQKLCEASQKSIQAQIKELKAKGIENLTDDEFEKFATLSDELITVENQKQKVHETSIATHNEKQKQQNSLIDAKLKAQDAQISGLRGALLEN